jgi:hypothetical protein
MSSYPPPSELNPIFDSLKFVRSNIASLQSGTELQTLANELYVLNVEMSNIVDSLKAFEVKRITLTQQNNITSARTQIYTTTLEPGTWIITGAVIISCTEVQQPLPVNTVYWKNCAVYLNVNGDGATDPLIQPHYMYNTQNAIMNTWSHNIFMTVSLKEESTVSLWIAASIVSPYFFTIAPDASTNFNIPDSTLQFTQICGLNPYGPERLT